jgi:hypothetical protein
MLYQNGASNYTWAGSGWVVGALAGAAEHDSEWYRVGAQERKLRKWGDESWV